MRDGAADDAAQYEPAWKVQIDDGVGPFISGGDRIDIIAVDHPGGLSGKAGDLGVENFGRHGTPAGLVKCLILMEDGETESFAETAGRRRLPLPGRPKTITRGMRLPQSRG